MQNETGPPPSPPINSPITMRRAAAQLVTVLARGAAEATAAAKVSNSCAAAGLLARRGFADDAALLKTPLYDFHVANGGASAKGVIMQAGGGRRRPPRNSALPRPAGCPQAGLVCRASAGCRRGAGLCSWAAQTHAARRPSYRKIRPLTVPRCCGRSLRRQDGALCGLVHAHPVQG